MKVLICTTDERFVESAISWLEERKIHFSRTKTGKDCQLQLFKEPYDVLLIDINTKAHSAFEVIKYVKQNQLKTKVILNFADDENQDLSADSLKKMGVHAAVSKKTSLSDMLGTLGFESSGKRKDSQAEEHIQKFLNEQSIKGLSLSSVEQGKQDCKTAFSFLQEDLEIAGYFKNLHESHQEEFEHLFLVAFYSAIISQNVDWTTPRIAQSVIVGGFLHDIGKHESLRGKKDEELKPEEISLFETHPRRGVEILRKCVQVGEPVLQIVFQHHELFNGKGFPNKLTGPRIYPLAKIVALANAFCSHLSSKKLNPIDCLRNLYKIEGI